MLTRYYKSEVFVKQLRSTPGDPCLDGFAEKLFEAGYVEITARRHIRSAQHLFYWTNCRRIPIIKGDETLEIRFKRHLHQCQCPQYGSYAKGQLARGVRIFLNYFWNGSVTLSRAKKQKIRRPPILDSFCEWMRLNRNISETALCNYSRAINDLLQSKGEDTSHLDAQTLRTFVVERSRRFGKGKNLTMITALRAFVRFLSSEGFCPAGLDAAIPRIARRKLSELPKYIQREDVELMLASCNSGTALGMRDRAILLLLARLALRASDVANMSVSDIDWKDGNIRVCGKGRREVLLPLLNEVGEAIATYVTKARPKTNSDALFIRLRAPFQGFYSHSAISVIVANAMHKSGIVHPVRGAAHVLRHTAATSMLREGASLQDIGGVLRHRSVEATSIYAKVDITALREIAQPWPEE